MRGDIASASGLAGNGGLEWIGSSEFVKLDQVWGFSNSEDNESEKSGDAMAEVWSKVCKWGDLVTLSCNDGIIIGTEIGV